MTALDHRPATRHHGPYASYMDVDRDVEPLFYVGKPGDGVRAAIDVEHLSRDLLANTLEAAGVSLGAYDRETGDLLGVLDPHLITVLCGWLERANKDEQRMHVLAIEARMTVARCVHSDCIETALRPIGTPFACEVHKTTPEGNR